MSATTAHAQQLSAETLLQDLVDDYGPKYSDVDNAIDQLRSGRLADARESLRTARQKNANLPPANLMLADILFRLKQVQPAQGALEEAVKEDPNDPGAYIYLGEVALQSRRWTEAKAMYDKGLELAQKYSANNKRKNRLMVSAYSGQASIAEMNENWQLAKSLLTTLLQIEGDNSLALTRLGRVMFKLSSTKDDEREVYALFKKMHANDEKTAYPDVNMALLYEQSGKSQNAKAMMERAATQDANNVRTRLAVAKWALDHEELDMAKTNAEAALKLEPRSLEAKLYMGLIARFRNDLPTAESLFKEAHLQSPTHLGAITQLALVLVDQSDEAKRTQALEYARLNTQLYSDLNEATGREAAVTFGWVLSKLGQTAAATKAVQQALTAGNGRISADNAYHAAQILYDGGMTEAAQKLLDQTLQSESVFPNRAAAEQLSARIKNR
ncbi:MAG: tetratricopeptide repeat protein [Planctomycetales bacterium]|nr:tetratricopeptide repeat protein [Planctomycetales bacterium]